MTELRCEECDKDFESHQAFTDHNQAKHSHQVKKPFLSKKIKKRIMIWSIVLLLILFVGYGFKVVGSAKSLPPTDMTGHIEVNPPTHIMKRPMRIEIQKHMLEHVDGVEGGKGGVIINYDCENYECEDSLIKKLETFTLKYDYVYVAPFRNMKVKIAVTKLRQIKTFDSFDEKGIDLFIGGSRLG